MDPLMVGAERAHLEIVRLLFYKRHLFLIYLPLPGVMAEWEVMAELLPALLVVRPVVMA
jgi:hypothetical protein